MSIERIVVAGPVCRVAIVGALLARRWAAESRELVLLPDTDADVGTTIIARPDQRSVHAELDLSLDDLARDADATPVFAVDARSVGKTVALPFSPFGLSRSGVEFHQFWHRGNARQSQPDLTSFSLALAMQGAPDRARFGAIGKLPLQVGLKLDRSRYAALLLKNASAHGAKIGGSVSAGEADLTIECNPSGDPLGWNGAVLRVGGDPDIPGLEWQVCVNAARRFIGLSSCLSQSENEEREYTRLVAVEAERIADMGALLNDVEPRETTRPSLKRKIDVFAACGRIPTEDFEVFGQPEWLAALWARGIRPRRHDRMANAMPEGELLGWLSAMHREIEQISQQGRAA